MGLFKRRNGKSGDGGSEPVKAERKPDDIGEQHNSEISNRFIARTDWNNEELRVLSIQDLCVLIGNAKWAREKQVFAGAGERMTGLIDQFYQCLVEKVKSAETLYTVIDETTSYPYIDENAFNCLWLFSERAYADNAVDYYKQQFRSFRVEAVGRGEQTAFLGEMLYMAGAAGVYLDNGLAGCMIKKEDLLTPPNWAGTPEISVPVTNPDFMLAHLRMRQELGWPVNYEKREEVLDRLELELSRQSVKARFLVPVKGMPAGREEASPVVLDKDTTVTIPRLTGRDGAVAIPAFTDWKQFRLCYSDTEYAGWIMTFGDLSAILNSEQGDDTIVVNIGKCPMEVNKKSLERMNTLLAKA